MESTNSPVIFTSSKEDKFFRKRHTATVSFAVGLLLFFLPFAELKCGNIPLMGNSGIGIATGTEWKVAMGGNKFLDKLRSETNDKNATKALSSGPNIILLVAIAAALFGISVVFFNQRWKNIAGMCAGILCCIMLLAVMIQFKILLRNSMGDSARKAAAGADMGRLIKIKFTIWYYLSFAAFAAAAFFNYKHHKIEMNEEIDKLIDFEFQREVSQRNSINQFTVCLHKINQYFKIGCHSVFGIIILVNALSRFQKTKQMAKN